MSPNVFAVMRYQKDGNYCFTLIRVIEWLQATANNSTIFRAFGAVPGLSWAVELMQGIKMDDGGEYQFLTFAKDQDDLDQTLRDLNGSIPTNRKAQIPTTKAIAIAAN